MPRKRETINYECYNKPFPSALRELMQENNTTQQQLAEVLGKTRQSISYYCDGSSSPDWETLAKIATFFNVSSDWLLGLSDVRSTSADIKSVCDFTGLSEASVGSILRETKHEESRRTINAILSFDANLFHNIIKNARKGIVIGEKYRKKPFNFELIPEEIRPELFDFFGIDPDGYEFTAHHTCDQYFMKAKNYLGLILLEYLVSQDGMPMYTEDNSEEDGTLNGNN